MSADVRDGGEAAAPHPAYRPDIDGLRAIAVLSVVGFHAFPSRVKAGFIGVDIFFVISGFLISSIIMKGLDAGRFSFADFYGRRVRRIFPALITVLTACFVYGWFALFAQEFAELGFTMMAGAAFFANFALWSIRGYFGPDADSMPLLHLWSLGVEEQFYLVWPVLLWMAWPLRRLRLPLILACMALSFAWNVTVVQTSDAEAFYSPLSRFWELLAGAAAAYAVLYMPGAARVAAGVGGHMLALAGAVVLAVTFMRLDAGAVFPGWWALPPVLGAVLLILSGPGSWAGRLLGNRVLVWVGLISYPLYLWHWPLLTFQRVVLTPDPAPWMRLGVVALSVLLAWLTYAGIERRMRFGGSLRAKAWALGGGLALVGGLGLVSQKTDGLRGLGQRPVEQQTFLDHFENRLPELRYLERAGVTANFREECNFYDLERFRLRFPSNIPRPAIDAACYTRDPARAHAVMIWGDSHAQQLHFGLKANLPDDWQMLQVATSKCPPELGVAGPSTTDFCTQSNWMAERTMREARPEVVVVGQRGGMDPARMAQLAEGLRALGVRRVVFTGAVPGWLRELPVIVARWLWPFVPVRTFVGIDLRQLDSNARVARAFPASDAVRFADIIGTFCNLDGCLVYLGDDVKAGVTSWDRGHLTAAASDYLARAVLRDLVLGTR